MSENPINFTLSENEIIKLLNYNGNTAYWVPLIISIMPFFMTIELIKFHFTDIRNFNIIITIVLYIFLGYSIISTIKCRHKAEEILKKEQELKFKDNKIFFVCGDYNISVPISRIKNIKKSKFFYRVEFNFNKLDNEYWGMPILPNIPCRVISEQEMETLASELKIKFK